MVPATRSPGRVSDATRCPGGVLEQEVSVKGKLRNLSKAWIAVTTVYPCMLAKSLQSCPTLCVARQASLSMGFSRREHWGGLPCPPPGDLPDPGIKPGRVSYTFCICRRGLYHWHHLGNPGCLCWFINYNKRTHFCKR